MLRVIRKHTTIDFIRVWRITLGVTLAFIIPGLLLIAAKKFHYSIEFTGGTLVQVQFTQPTEDKAVRQALDAGGLQGAEVARFGSEREYVIRAQGREAAAAHESGAEQVRKEVATALDRKFPAGSYAVQRVETVGPKVGAELRQKALYAVLISFFVTLTYLAWRFEWRFGLAAVIATAHDILATLAFIKYLNLEISLVVVGGILTMIGYSLNDTIIIFDRTRENLRKHRKQPLYDTLNESINETLPRSILTHATVAATLLALLVLGGEVIRPFAWVMLFGVITGTFSSIYVAAPILLWIERKWPRAVDDRSGVGARPSEKQSIGTTRPRSQREPVGSAR